jgi:Mg2+/Co2+ transporter CorB
MQSLNDEEKRTVFGEVLADRLKAIPECVKYISFIKRDLSILKNGNQIKIVLFNNKWYLDGDLPTCQFNIYF